MSCDSSETWQIGDRPLLKGTFTDENGDVVDPTVVKFKVKNPSGTITPYIWQTDTEVVHISTGVFGVRTDLDEAGTWTYRWYSTGTTRVAAGEATFEVETSAFPAT